MLSVAQRGYFGLITIMELHVIHVVVRLTELSLAVSEKTLEFLLELLMWQLTILELPQELLMWQLTTRE
jgi:hypothetical protein